MLSIAEILSQELGQKLEYVENVIALIDEGNTIPFIARYRKEMHGAMDDTTLRNLETRLTYLRNLQQRRDEVKKSIENQGKLTEELATAIDNAVTLAEVEDLYRPYKQKRRTRGTVAREKGLEPLAAAIFAQDGSDPAALAQAYIDPEKGVNTIEDAPTLIAVNMYNQMYDKAANDMPVLDWGDYCIYMPKLVEYGRMGAYVGKKNDGTVYKLEPNEENMVKVDMKVNNIKPYIGFGYGNSMMDNNKKYNVSMECGVLFWGGVPNVITHDGTDITRGFKKVWGKQGDYVDIVKKFKAFPVINVRIARRLF